MNLDTIGEWIERTPPFSWATQLNHWLARHLVDPWLNPLIRPLEHRHAVRRIEQLTELRATVAHVPQAAGHIDAVIDAWAKRANETA